MTYGFTWTPAEKARHASLDPAPACAYPSGATVTTLCGRKVVTESGDYPWLWPTCGVCDEQARKLVGAPSAATCERRES